MNSLECPNLSGLATRCRRRCDELLIDVLQDGAELLGLWFAHVLAEQLVAGGLVLPDALNLWVNTDLVQNSAQERACLLIGEAAAAALRVG